MDLLLPLHHVVLDRSDAAFVIAAETLRTDPAGQTAGRFRLRFLFGIACVHFLERGGPLCHRTMFHGDARRDADFPAGHLFFDFLVSHLHHRQLRLDRRFHLFAPEIPVHAGRRLVSGGNGFDDVACAGGRIPSRKNPGASGGKGIGVDRDGGGAGNSHAGAFRDKGEPRPLPDGKNHHFAREKMFAPLFGFQVQATFAVKFHEGHVHGFHPGDMAVLFQDPPKRPAVVNADPLFLRLFDFNGVGRHLLPAFQTGHLHLGRA